VTRFWNFWDPCISEERLKWMSSLKGVVNCNNMLLTMRGCLTGGYSFSTSHTCSYGVPQGSVRGPLLFVLHTTPLSTLISSLSLNHHLYADNTELFISFYPSDLDSSITHLQNALQQISSWMTANLSNITGVNVRNLASIFHPV